MNPLLLEILPYVHQGYCCSQLLILLSLRLLGRESPDLLQASRGLCYGLGQSNGPCGLLTGGACALALFSAEKSPEGEANSQAIINDYALWFAEEVAPFGGINCEQVALGLGLEAGSPNPIACGQLLCACYEKIINLLSDYELLPA